MLTENIENRRQNIPFMIENYYNDSSLLFLNFSNKKKEFCFFFFQIHFNATIFAQDHRDVLEMLQLNEANNTFQ